MSGKKPKIEPKKEAVAKWRCTVCGWICEGKLPNCPPEECPECGAPREAFEKIS